MAMNCEVCSSSGKTWVRPITPPRSEEKVCQSRLTSRTSSARVTDQNPSSSGYSWISLQCTGQPWRRSRKISCGGPLLPVLAIDDVDLVELLLPVGPLALCRHAASLLGNWLTGQFLFAKLRA